MELGLPPHVHYAICDTLILFLDTKADRYRSVPRVGVLSNLLAQEGKVDDAEPSCRRLADAGLLAPIGGANRRCSPTRVEVPDRSVLETGRSRAPLSPRVAARAARAARALWRAQFDLRVRDLDIILDRVRARRSSTKGNPIDRDALIARSLAFADHRALLPAKRICLRDSLALLAFLGDAAVGADLVFGVQAKPFYAHCWVQTDSLILNDSGFFPSTLTPILRA